MTTLIISNEEMNDTMKIAKSFKESGLLIKGVLMTKFKMKENKQKAGFVWELLGSISDSLSGNLLIGKWVIRAGGGTIRDGQNV